MNVSLKQFNVGEGLFGLQPSGNILSVNLWTGPAVLCLDVGPSNDGGPSEHTAKYVT